MNWRALALLIALLSSLSSLAHEEDSAPPSQGFVLTSLAISTTGAVIVTVTLLALFWNTIDGAFRRSRFRTNWEKRPIRIGFGIGAIALAGIAGSLVALSAVRDSHHDLDAHDSGIPEATHGGVIQVGGRFGFEVVLRRTGEVRLYIQVLTGPTPSAWDIKAALVPVTGFEPGVTNAIPLKLNANSSYFVSALTPPVDSVAKMRLAASIQDQKFDLDYTLPVQD